VPALAARTATRPVADLVSAPDELGKHAPLVRSPALPSQSGAPDPGAPQGPRPVACNATRTG
jgi:hypothetical protein